MYRRRYRRTVIQRRLRRQRFELLLGQLHMIQKMTLSEPLARMQTKDRLMPEVLEVPESTRVGSDDTHFIKESELGMVDCHHFSGIV